MFIFEDKTINVEKKEDDGSPDVEKTTENIKKSMNDGFSQMGDQILQMNVRNGVDKFIRDNPEYKEFEEEILKQMTNENRLSFLKNGYPFKDMFLAVLAPFISKANSSVARKAQEEADSSGTPGYTVRQKLQKTEAVARAEKALQMNNSDFIEEIERMKMGK